MLLPTISEYKIAIRNASRTLRTLKDYEPVMRADGEPWFCTGGLAAVFKMKHRETGKLIALKCFHKAQENRAESYHLITECLQDYPSPYLLQYEYKDNEIFVNSAAAGKRGYPVLAMDWAEGVTLGEYVRTCCTRNDRAALQNLIEEFNWFAFWLLSQPFAHGDLKPDNIVVRPDGKPVLLDYDGMYVPAMKGQPARELGSPVYRHPARTVEVFDKRIDDFGLLVLLLELRLLAAEPGKHAGRGGSESLYFQAEDLRGQHWRTGLPQMDALQHLLHCFDAALDGAPVDLAALLFAVLRGDTPPAPLPVEKPRVAILQKRFEWEPEMVFVEGGTFWMGCTSEQQDCNNSEKPAHSVTLDDFYIGRYEVTQRLWTQVMGTNPSRFINCDDCPVECVSWDDMQEFILKLNAQTGKRYRLPTEAEWEYAARGGKKTKGYQYAGSDNLDEVAWYRSNAGGKTKPVGGKKANELGLYDMSGNVVEWCSDWYEDKYPAAAQTNPTGSTSGSHRVYRGGFWASTAWGCRVAYRGLWAPVLRHGYLGFRLALSP